MNILTPTHAQSTSSIVQRSPYPGDYHSSLATLPINGAIATSPRSLAAGTTIDVIREDCRPETGGRRHLIANVAFDFLVAGQIPAVIDYWRSAGLRSYITITNPHSVMLCHRDTDMRRATEEATLTLPDGVGIVLAAKLLGYGRRHRVTGPDLMLKLCDWGREYGFRHYFYGGAEGIGQRLADSLSGRFPGLVVAGVYTPPFRTLSAEEDEQVITQINKSKPDVVWVGLGAPKQEKWMLEHQGRIAAPAMIGVGAAFDFHSGNVKWAPRMVRRLGLEWAHRLLLEPRRMWRRNLDSPLFLGHVACQRIAALFRRSQEVPRSRVLIAKP